MVRNLGIWSGMLSWQRKAPVTTFYGSTATRVSLSKPSVQTPTLSTYIKLTDTLGPTNVSS